MKEEQLKVGDWVRIRLTGVHTINEPPYQIEEIKDDIYHVVQKEGKYRHRMKLTGDKLLKL